MNGVTESYNLTALEPDRALFEAHLDANEIGLASTDHRLIINLVDTALRPNESGAENYYGVHRTNNTTLMNLADWAAQRPTQSWIDMRTGEFKVGR